MRFTELTIWQREPLFQLVKYQLQVGREVVFYGPDRSPMEIQPEGTGSGSVVVATATPPTVELWEAGEYISLKSYAPGTRDFVLITTYTFVLRQNAFDYHTFMQRRPASRALREVGWQLRDNLHALIWAVVGGALVLIIQALIG